MKGLLHLPALYQLQEWYENLQRTKRALLPEQIALLSQWSRFDPRLSEQLASHLMQYWKQVPPLELNQHILQQPWPATLGVLLKQVGDFVKFELCDKKLFRAWSTCVLTGIKMAPHEHYFIGSRAFGGTLLFEDTLFSHRSFKNWGYFGREIFINKAKFKLNRTIIPKKTRKLLLHEFLKNQKKFTVADYRQFLGNAISIRQAQLDLCGLPGIKSQGKTRGKYFVTKRVVRPDEQ